MKRRLHFASLLSMALALCTLPATAATNVPARNPQLYLNLTTDHADAVYAVGETVTWTIAVTGLKSGEAPPEPAFSVTAGKTELTNGTLRFVGGKAQVSARLNKPGVLALQVGQSTPWQNRFARGAAVGWPEIKSTVPEPADFDAFWKKKLEELAAVPMNPALEEVDSGATNVRLWKVTLDGFRGSKVNGYLARPPGTNSLPALVQVPYMYLHSLQKSAVVGIAKNGWLALTILEHDAFRDRDAAFYKDAGIDTQAGGGPDDPEKSYFTRMFLSASRAVDYLADRDDWNGRTLVVQGGSQGGFQGLAVAGLNPKVTALTVFVPGGCDLTGFLEGRPNGWAGPVGSKAMGADRDAWIRTAGYYDAKNFAKRIKCPTLVGVALLDSIASPISQFTMFNNLTAPKRLVLLPEDEHISPHTAYKTVQAAWWKAAAAGEPVPLK